MEFLIRRDSMKLFSSLGRDLGIDIGTFHTNIFVYAIKDI